MRYHKRKDDLATWEHQREQLGKESRSPLALPDEAGEMVRFTIPARGMPVITAFGEWVRYADVHAQRPRWISVEERLPEPEVVDAERATFVPVLFSDGRSVCAGRFDPRPKVRWCWRSLQGMEYMRKDITHWQPLPNPPQKGST